MNSPVQKLYVKSGDKLVRTENLPMVSLAIGNYVSRIYYIPDNEFDELMKEIKQELTKEHPTGSGKYVDNRVITIFSESNLIDCFLRPDSMRDKDREDIKKEKADKARSTILKIIKG